MFLRCFDKNIGWAPAKSIRPINVSVRRPKVNSNQLTETECSCSCSKVCQHAGQLSQNSTFDMHTTYFIHKALKEIWKYYNSSHQNNNNISLIPDETKSTSFLSFNADGDSTV